MEKKSKVCTAKRYPGVKGNNREGDTEREHRADGGKTSLPPFPLPPPAQALSFLGQLPPLLLYVLLLATCPSRRVQEGSPRVHAGFGDLTDLLVVVSIRRLELPLHCN